MKLATPGALRTGLVVVVRMVNLGLTYRGTRRSNEDAGWVTDTH